MIRDRYFGVEGGNRLRRREKGSHGNAPGGTFMVSDKLLTLAHSLSQQYGNTYVIKRMDIAKARRMVRHGATPQEVHDAIGYGGTVRAMRDKLRTKYNIRWRK
jgi:hypothetical protein